MARTTGGILALAAVFLASCDDGSGGSAGVGAHYLWTKAYPAGPGLVGSPRFSPDGTLLAYARNAGAVYELAVMTALGTDPHTVAGDADRLLTTAWTADGSTIIYGTMNTGMRTVPLSGGPSQLWLDVSDAINPDLSPDGRWLAYGVYTGYLHLADLSQNPPVLSDLGFPVDSARFSPDGATLAVVTPNIKLLDLATRTLTEVTDNYNALGRVAWFPDGTRLLAGTDRGVEIITLGPPVQRQLIRGDPRVVDVDVSTDGTRAAFAEQGQSNLFVTTGF